MLIKILINLYRQYQKNSRIHIFRSREVIECIVLYLKYLLLSYLGCLLWTSVYSTVLDNLIGVNDMRFNSTSSFKSSKLPIGPYSYIIKWYQLLCKLQNSRVVQINFGRLQEIIFKHKKIMNIILPLLMIIVGFSFFQDDSNSQTSSTSLILPGNVLWFSDGKGG